MSESPENVREPAPIPNTRPCDNPECRRHLKWSTERGRPQLYCSSKCRKRAVSIAAKLSRAIRTQERELQLSKLTYRAEREVRTELARLEWLLSAYPTSAETTLR